MWQFCTFYTFPYLVSCLPLLSWFSLPLFPSLLISLLVTRKSKSHYWLPSSLLRPVSTSEETVDTTIDHHLSSISQTNFADRIVVQDDLSRPIPMPYYPLFPETTSHHHVPTTASAISIVSNSWVLPLSDQVPIPDTQGINPRVHYVHTCVSPSWHPANKCVAWWADSTSLFQVASYSSSTTTVVPSLHDNPLCSHETLGVMPFDTGALSDTELNLQNRIARKINRLRHRRLGRRKLCVGCMWRGQDCYLFTLGWCQKWEPNNCIGPAGSLSNLLKLYTRKLAKSSSPEKSSRQYCLEPK